ncbi:Transportin-PC [Phlyctochytrium arcticum]|nr:Transportin-PC [Phlyctochytrium arcticum]
MSWQPRPEDLELLRQLLRNSTSSDNNVQKEVRQKLESFTQIPEYPNYLACIMTIKDGDPQADAARTIAGLTLKNYVKLHIESMSPTTVAYMKECVVQVLSDDAEAVRSAAGSIVTTILSNNINNWPEVLPILIQLIDRPEPHAVEGAFSALQKICEDSAQQLEEKESHALSFMIQKFIHHFANPNPKVRAAAIQCVNQFVLMQAEGFMVNLDAYVQALYARANDTYPDVRKLVCQALVMLLETIPQALQPQLDNVVNFMIFCTEGDDDEVALEACEFWPSFAEQPELRDNLVPYIPRIIPVLLKGMVYSADDIAILAVETEDAAVPDKDQDIKPRHHKARTHALDHDGSGQPVVPGAQAEGDDEDESDYDDDDDEDVYTEWNLRKCSAAALDVMANVFGTEILAHLLPPLKDNLFHSDWEHRECGILALGAIAEGCIDGMMDHLPTLVPHMVTCLKDSQPLVRAIACWTLGRYAKWTVHPPPHWVITSDAELVQHRETYFRPLVLTLLETCLDNNKRVQEAACSALATVEEEATTELVPYLETVLQTQVLAFDKYQHKNLLILYDAVGTLADSVGSALSNDRFINLLMTPLVRRWQMIEDMDRGIFPLFECMSSVATALGPKFAPFAQEVWQRCVRIVQTTFQLLQNQHQLPAHVEVDRDFIVVSLDLLSGVAQGLNFLVDPLVSQLQPGILTLLPICMKDESPEVRQSAYALLGDLAISAFPHLKPLVNQYLPELIQQITPSPASNRVSVINNAIWAAGEIALKNERDMEPWVNPLLERLIPILTRRGDPKAIVENAAITLGRLGFVCPESVAPHLQTFIEPWCQSLCDIRDNLEKQSAFQGLCRMIELNPNGVVDHFGLFCDAVARWNRVSPELNQTFETILHGFKNGAGDKWPHIAQSLSPLVKQRLSERYSLF